MSLESMIVPLAAGLKPAEAMTTSLTVESLLFAALAVSYSLAEPTARGRHPFFSQGFFAWSIVLAITAVAASAGAGWWAIYSPDWPDGRNAWLQAGGVAVGIVVQPLFAAAIAWGARDA